MVVWMWLMCTWIIRAPWWPGWLLSWDRHWEHCHNSESPLTTPPRLVIPAEKERMFILLHTLWTHGHEFTRNSWITLRFGDKFIIALLLRVWYCFYLCKANMTVSFNGRSGHRQIKCKQEALQWSARSAVRAQLAKYYGDKFTFVEMLYMLSKSALYFVVINVFNKEPKKKEL